MKIFDVEVVMREVPDEISLSFAVAGCPLKCKDCHWKVAEANAPKTEFSVGMLQTYLDKYKDTISNVLFFGGEWEHDTLMEMLKIVKLYNLKTTLYTGLEYDDVDKRLFAHLDYLKVGGYIAELGALDKTTTNQRLYNLNEDKDITYLFWDELEKEA